MPLIVTDYTWTQTESTVYINVPLKGVKLRQLDILCTDEYLKVHFPPFLFEAFLLEPVDSDKSAAKIGNGVAVITLPKRIDKMWERLTITTTDKEGLKQIREKALSQYSEKLTALSESKAEKREAEKKYALKTMMKMEKEERASIKKIKEEEQAKASAELEAWKFKQKEKAKEEARQKQQSQRVNTEKQEAKKKPPVNGSNNNQRDSKDTQSNRRHVDVPAPRAAGNIQVTFTPRVFPTALRDSKVQEEEEWLQKQAEARRAVDADMDQLADLKEEERNPDWLKEKGDKCFAAGDYLGAVNAYNMAIKLNAKLPALFSNRAACHLKLRNLHKAIKDSSQALHLLTPPVAANASARARAHVRRGSAFCQLQLYIEALQDYQAALKIDASNEALQADMQRIKAIIQGSATEQDQQ
ncbi:dynein axonemal assembly factor 4 [Genypterus blacodes]|uniref:dynein axonemal assembly factor 4 n=1 Tax=Genypterus blacodes TaxID=154954 RepID=UPI003F76846D